MTDTIHTTYGSCISLDWTFKDSLGEAEDLSGCTFEVIDAHPSSLAEDFEITAVDLENGKIELFLGHDDALKLRMGRTNKFRLSRIFPDGCRDNTPEIWIDVK